MIYFESRGSIHYLDAYSTTGEYSWIARLFACELVLDPAAVLVTTATRMDSSKYCPRALGFQPSCPYDNCRQCSAFFIMMNGLGPRGTIGGLGQQLLNQFPVITDAIRSQFYGHASYMEFDRSKIQQGYGILTAVLT